MLTQAQKTALKVNLAANVNTITNFAGGQPIAINAVNLATDGGDNTQRIADWYNGIGVPDFFVFKSSVNVQDIYDQITWANYTPQDTPDTTVQWSNRSLACQGKQFNLQIMLQQSVAINAGHINLRAGINDATTNLPSGASGATKSGGWAGILTILKRQASNLEKLFAVQTSGVGTNIGNPLGDTTNPALLVVEMKLNSTDLLDAFLNG